jgi:phage-related protein
VYGIADATGASSTGSIRTVLILEVFEKRTQKTPPAVIHECQRRLREYDQAVKEG